MREELISIIIPVYNAEKYLNKCMETVTKQTYENIEIILINDGSKDNSKEICKEWIEKDKRVVYLEQVNSGQGVARNKAIEIATGEYVAFVDADDWVDKNYISDMYNAIILNNADMCRGNSYCIYDEADNKETVCNDIPKSEFISESPHLWMNLIKRTIFTDNNIIMPNMPYEDMAIYPLLPLLARKVCFIAKPLYYYRINTGISTMDNGKHLKVYPKALQYMIDELKRFHLYDRYEPEILETCVGHMTSGLRIAREKLGKEEYGDTVSAFQKFLAGNFKEWKNTSMIGNIWIWGSYNLTRIVANFKTIGLEYSLLTKDLPYYFGFSSITSCVSPKLEEEIPLHKNTFRQNMLEKDFSKTFQNIHPGLDDCILVDLLEERYDVIKLEESYITCSEVLKESSYEVDKRKLLSLRDKEQKELWVKSCSQFIRLLKEKFKPENVILVKNYLTTEKLTASNEGTQIGRFSPREEIIKTNEYLQSCYEYFQENFEGIKVVDIPEEYYYTDGNSKYGTGPEYLNVRAHKKMAKNIIGLF